MSNKSTGERLEFYDFSEVTVEHLHRYAIAKNYVKNKRVLDIASGEGYGTYILSKSAKSVVGVDIDKKSIEMASEKYKNSNLIFTEGSADNIPLENKSIDVVISFETIEHHDKHEEMLFEIARVLKPDGILIMSSPDKKYYSDITGFKNKFHVKELYFEEFKELIKRHFKSSNFYFQKSYNLNSYIYGVNCVETVVYSGSFNEVYKHELEPLYNIVIASQCFTDEMKPSIFDGSSITDLLIRARIKSNTEHIKQTTSYRIGNFLCFPFFCLKKIIKNG